MHDGRFFCPSMPGVSLTSSLIYGQVSRIRRPVLLYTKTQSAAARSLTVPLRMQHCLLLYCFIAIASWDCKDTGAGRGDICSRHVSASIARRGVRAGDAAVLRLGESPTPKTFQCNGTHTYMQKWESDRFTIYIYMLHAPYAYCLPVKASLLLHIVGHQTYIYYV